MILTTGFRGVNYSNDIIEYLICWQLIYNHLNKRLYEWISYRFTYRGSFYFIFLEKPRNKISKILAIFIWYRVWLIIFTNLIFIFERNIKLAELICYNSDGPDILFVQNSFMIILVKTLRRKIIICALWSASQGRSDSLHIVGIFSISEIIDMKIFFIIYNVKKQIAWLQVSVIDVLFVEIKNSQNNACNIATDFSFF